MFIWNSGNIKYGNGFVSWRCTETFNYLQLFQDIWVCNVVVDNYNFQQATTLPHLDISALNKTVMELVEAGGFFTTCQEIRDFSFQIAKEFITRIHGMETQPWSITPYARTLHALRLAFANNPLTQFACVTYAYIATPQIIHKENLLVIRNIGILGAWTERKNYNCIRQIQGEVAQYVQRKQCSGKIYPLLLYSKKLNLYKKLK